MARCRKRQGIIRYSKEQSLNYAFFTVDNGTYAVGGGNDIDSS